MLTFNHGSAYFLNKVALNKFISVIHHIFISHKLKKLKEEESLLFGPTGVVDCIYSSIYPYILHWSLVLFSPKLIQVKSQIHIFPPFQNKHPNLDLNFSMLRISYISVGIWWKWKPEMNRNTYCLSERKIDYIIW